MNKNNSSGSEQQEDISMNLDDDKNDVQGSGAGEDFGSEAPVVDKNVGEEYLRSQPSTSRNEGRKRLSQSSYPCTEKVSRTICKEENQPQEDNISTHESELLKANAGASSITNVVTVRYAENVKNEHSVIHCPVKCEDGSVPGADNIDADSPIIQCPVKCEEGSVPVAGNIKDEPPVIQGPVKFGSVMLSNDCKDDSEANISPASTSSDEVEILTEVRNWPVCVTVDEALIRRWAELSRRRSMLLATSVGGSGPANVVTEHKTENIKDEPPVIQCQVKCEDEPGMLSNDCKDHSEANISSTSTSSDDVTLIKEIWRFPNRNQSLLTISLDHVPVEGSELHKTSAGGSGFANAENIKEEPPVIPNAENINEEPPVIPNAENIKDEPPVIQCPVKCEPGMSSNDCEDNSKANISSASTSSESVKLLKEVHRIFDEEGRLLTFTLDHPVLEESIPKTSAGGSGFANVANVPNAENNKDEAPLVPNAENIKDEPPAILCPVKCENESGVLSNDGKDCARTSGSSASTSSGEVKISGAKTHSSKKQFYLPYEKYLKCDKCGKIFPHEKYLMEHRGNCN